MESLQTALNGCEYLQSGRAGRDAEGGLERGAVYAHIIKRNLRYEEIRASVRIRHANTGKVVVVVAAAVVVVVVVAMVAVVAVVAEVAVDKGEWAVVG